MLQAEPLPRDRRAVSSPRVSRRQELCALDQEHELVRAHAKADAGTVPTQVGVTEGETARGGPGFLPRSRAAGRWTRRVGSLARPQHGAWPASPASQDPSCDRRDFQFSPMFVKQTSFFQLTGYELCRSALRFLTHGCLEVKNKFCVKINVT